MPRTRWVSGSLVVTVTSLVVACGGAPKEASAPGVVGDTIVVAALSPLSDAVAVIGKPLAAGLQGYAKQLNAKGGIAGRYQLKVVEEDITYANPTTGAQKYQKVKDNVALIAMTVGTDQVNGLLPLMAEDSMLLIPTTFDVEWVREPNILPWGAPYQVWAINGVAYYLETAGAGKTICSLVLATGYGQAAEEGLAFAAKELGFQVAVKGRFRQDDQDFVAPISQLRNARCDAVVLASLPGVTGKVLGAAAQLGFEPRWISQGPTWHQTLVNTPLRDYYAKNLWVVAWGPEWDDTTAVGMRGVLEAAATFFPNQEPDLYFIAGYLQGMTTHALLEKAIALGDLSRGGILRAMEQLTVPTGDLIGEYRYGPVATREPPRTVSIFKMNPTKPFGIELMARDYTSPVAAKYSVPQRH